MTLTTFRLRADAPAGTKPSEDYWRLIGATGTIVGCDSSDGLERLAEGPRLLVMFDENVARLGLHCHNRVANALYIFEHDLTALS